MARIIDKDTRLIDVDFGPLSVNIGRTAETPFPDGTAGNIATIDGDGQNSLLRFDEAGVVAGSFIQFKRLDLDYMTMNNEVMQPVEVSVQRTASTPDGTHSNGNNFKNMYEYIFILSRPLNNQDIIASFNPYIVFNKLGLDTGSSAYGGPPGSGGGGVSHAQNIYAECRTYSFSLTDGATQANGELVSGGTENSFFTDMRLAEVNTWGTMSAITGPNLYCYRVLYSELQSFPGGHLVFENVGLGGYTTLYFPPVNVTFLCKDPNYTEGEYLTRLANAMNSIPEGGATN